MKQAVNGDLLDLARAQHSYVAHVYGTVAQSATNHVQIKSGAYELIILGWVVVAATQSVKVTLTEGPTVTDGTSALTPDHIHRGIGGTSSATVYTNPTSISGGTLLTESLVPSGGNKTGGSSGAADFWTLKQNEDYIWSVENLGNSDTLYELAITWHENR
jgi:hypothetical protein